MKTKKKTAVWFIWMFLLLYLTVWITGIQVKAEDAEPAVAAQVGTITVYNDVNHNGHYYYYKDGIPITVYCYHHDESSRHSQGLRDMSGMIIFQRLQTSHGSRLQRK